ncbi:hypothetical protein NPIL_395201, partial [Nephila pilipes]
IGFYVGGGKGQPFFNITEENRCAAGLGIKNVGEQVQ